MVDEWVYKIVTAWVAAKEAYTETAVTGGKCHVCGKTEQLQSIGYPLSYAAITRMTFLCVTYPN